MTRFRIYFTLLLLVIAFASYSQSLEERAQVIANQIFHTMEPYRHVPEIKIVKDQIIAQTRELPVPQILLGQKSFSICRALAKDSIDALAVIIGHELAHLHLHHSHVDQHQSNGEFLELQADYLGLTKGFNSGYSSFQVFPAVLEQVKQADPNYSSRMAQNNQLLDQIQKWYYLQEATNFFIATKQYDYAMQLNTFLRKQLNLPLLINNEAYIVLSQILEFGSEDNQYQYPLKWDAGQQFYKLNKGSDRFPDGTTVKQRLESSRISLERLHSDFPDYQSCLVNLASLYLIADNLEQANELIAGGLQTNPQDYDLLILNAICDLKTEKLERAKSSLKSLSNHPVAHFNLEIVQESQKSLMEKITDWTAVIFETMASQISENSKAPEKLLNYQYNSLQTIPGQKPLSVAYFEGPSFTALQLNIGFGAFYVKKTDHTNHQPDWPMLWVNQGEYVIHFDGTKAFHYQFFFNPF